MILIIGVRFRKSSKVYYFDPTGYEIKKGDHVIVETCLLYTSDAADA